MTRRVGDSRTANSADGIGEDGRQPRAPRPEGRPGARPESSGTDGLWEIAHVSRYLSIPVNSIYKMTARNAAVRIPHIRIGGKLRFRRVDIDRWLSLLTVSNVETLARMRQSLHRDTYGHDSQTDLTQR